MVFEYNISVLAEEIRGLWMSSNGIIMHSISPVQLMRRQYLQLLDPEQLTLPSKDLLRLPKTQAMIYDCMFDSSQSKHPPPDRYRYRVLKRLVKALEESILDPEEDVC